MNIADMTSECPLCGGKEVATGEREEKERGMYWMMKCTECGSTGLEWRKEWES